MLAAVYDDVVIDKPWGYEYLMFRNSDVALWYLLLKRDERTSLHCHPRKKTGFVVLAGSVSLCFLNNTSVLQAPANVMIRAGLFHQSVADRGTDVALIEVETPVDKADLVRLDDSYGRQKAGYEPISATRPIDSNCLRLSSAGPRDFLTWECHDRVLRMHGCTNPEELAPTLSARDIVVVLEGGLRADGDAPILGPGDVVSASTLSRLSGAFASPNGISALVIAAPDTPGA